MSAGRPGASPSHDLRFFSCREDAIFVYYLIPWFKMELNYVQGFAEPSLAFTFGGSSTGSTSTLSSGTNQAERECLP